MSRMTAQAEPPTLLNISDVVSGPMPPRDATWVHSLPSYIPRLEDSICYDEASVTACTTGGVELIEHLPLTWAELIA